MKNYLAESTVVGYRIRPKTLFSFPQQRMYSLPGNWNSYRSPGMLCFVFFCWKTTVLSAGEPRIIKKYKLISHYLALHSSKSGCLWNFPIILSDLCSAMESRKSKLQLFTLLSLVESLIVLALIKRSRALVSLLLNDESNSIRTRYLDVWEK